MNKKSQKLFFNTQHLQNSNTIEFHYNYNFLGILKMMAGGTPIPESIEIFRKSDHKYIATLKNKKLLDEMADD